MLQTENDQVKAHLYKMKGSTSSVEGGSDSLHDEMQASSQNGSTNGGSSSVGKASAPLHGEIQTSGYGGSTSNIAQVVRDNLKESVGKVKERIDHSQTIPKTKRSYQIGRNTGLDLRNLGSKKRNKPEEK
jgi:hypothetical protein